MAILRGKIGAKKNFSRAQRALWRAAPKGAAGGKPHIHYFLHLIFDMAICHIFVIHLSTIALQFVVLKLLKPLLFCGNVDCRIPPLYRTGGNSPFKFHNLLGLCFEKKNADGTALSATFFLCLIAKILQNLKFSLSL